MTVWPALTLAAPMWLGGCGPAPSPGRAPDAAVDASATPLPTRQTTIEPIAKKLDAAQLEAERRRAEADRIGQ